MADVLQLDFETPEGESLDFEWDETTLTQLTEPAADGKPEWTLAGEIDWDEIEAIRLLGGRFEDGRTLAVGAIRPAGADGHGDEIAIGALRDEEGPVPLEEVLISTEYDAAELPRRVGLELFREGEKIPLRVAGDVRNAASLEEGAVHRLRAILELRLDGTPGVGVYEILTAS
jgi:hypothetical protein